MCEVCEKTRFCLQIYANRDIINWIDNLPDFGMEERFCDMMNTVSRKMKRMLAACLGAGAAVCAMATTAFAEGEAAADGAAGSAWTELLISMIPFLIAIALMYLILFRPQKKREQEAQKMRDNVRIGDEICTAGGLIGIVIRVAEDTVVMETGGERSKIRVKKWAIHENITQMEEAQAAEKERKAARQKGIAVAAEKNDSEKK